MSMLRGEFPVLVEQRKSGFCVQPLLTPGDIVTRARYGDAVSTLQKTMRKQLSNSIPTADNLEHLLWFVYSPDLNFELLYIVMKSGIRHVEGLFAVVTFSVKNQRYFCLPKFDHLIFRVTNEHRSKQHFVELVESKIAWFFRQLRKERDNFDAKPYMSEASDSYVLVNTSIETANPRFPFASYSNDNFAFSSEIEQFDGATELNKVAEDLSILFPYNLESAFFREKETIWLDNAVFEGKPQAVVLVGAIGIGKTNLIQHSLCQYLNRQHPKATHKLQKIWLLDPLRVIAGMSVVGQWERRFEGILQRIRDRLNPKDRNKHFSDILYVDNAIALLRIGKSSQTSLTLSHLLKPYLERRDIPVILEATPEEWQKIQALDRGFADFFQVLRLKPLNQLALNRVYTRRRAEIEKNYQCTIESRELLTVLKTEPSFRGNTELPGSVVKILQNLAIRNHQKKVTEDDVYLAFQSQFHIKKALIDGSVVLKRQDVLAHFAANLIGQTEACSVLTDTVLSIKAKLTPPGRPLNTMMFIGPTGVGKTEAAKLLARYLFDRKECLVRIDMNEYVDEHAVERLIGTQHHAQGILTEQVRYTRACVLLLDEVEKAHPRVHDLLLQLLDDGRLTDAMGHTTDFTQCVIIMTSNVGSQEASMEMGFLSQQQKHHSSYQKALEAYFRPELINRINNVVIFNNLQPSDMEFLAKIHLKKLLQRDGFIRRKTILNVEEKCLSSLAASGYDPNLGARALKRHLERTISRMSSNRLSTLTSNDPVILNVSMHEKELNVTITQLEYVQELEGKIHIEDTSYNIDDYKAIAAKLDATYECLSTLTTSIDQKIKYMAWSLSTAVRDLLEPLRNFIWEQEERIKTSSLLVAFSAPSGKRRLQGRWRSTSINTAAFFAQNDMNDYLLEIYSKSDDAFSGDVSRKMQLVTDSHFLVYASQCLSSQGLDHGTILISPLSSGVGHKQIEFIAQELSLQISDIGQIENKSIHDESNIAIEVSGCGIHNIMHYQCGVHLFLEPSRIQVPVYIQYFAGQRFNEIQTQQDERLDKQTYDVVRLYTVNDNKHSRYNVLDLRLGIMSGTELSTVDYNFLNLSSILEQRL